MSKKIVALSLFSLCVLLCGCWSQDNGTVNVCTDDTCAVGDTQTAEARTNNRATSEIEDDIDWLTQDSDEIPVAEKLSWEPIVVQWWERDL